MVARRQVRPEIWRRVQLRGDLTLDRVHTCLQVILGWEDSHLHRFSAPGVDAWSPPWFVTAYDEDELDEEGTPESEVRLDQVLRAAGEWLIYTYDFGDDWRHRIEVEEVRLAQGGDPPALCLEGVGACPPEDVGGIFTWNELAAALRADPDPDHLSGELEQYADWLPEGSNPDLFELEDVNAEIATLASGLDLPPLHPVLTNLLAHCHPDLRDELTELLIAAAQRVAPAVSDEQWAALLRPWQTLLDEADPDGIPLTAAGWIAPVV
ncbi:plasmid pRiA4b ORF-3 family protein [Nostocoides veronense]|uniref:plasmid pRiA4b ORF-3 family protein n=1 Tax=Nostocoides veronense TaxID=330836 RepID=UPI0031D2DBE6